MSEEQSILLTDEYFEIHQKYEKKYKKVVVLMEVGMFHEIYGLYEPKIVNIKEITDLLNIQLSRKNKSNPIVSRSNPAMAGFPSYTLQKYLQILLNNGYNVILYEQVRNGEEKKNKKEQREITKFLSVGTYIDEIKSSNSNNIIVVYTTKDFVASFAVIDLSIGNVTLYTVKLHDEHMMKEEIFRFVESHVPVETIYYDDLRTGSHYYKNSYQNEFLGKIYSSGLLTPIEYLDLEYYPQLTIALILLLEYVYEHDEKILVGIQKPTFWKSNLHLVLHHNTIYQLNVIPTQQNPHHSLFDIVNKTKTPMGKRLLKYNLLNPIIDPVRLMKIYDEIESHIGPIEELKDIRDIERFHRKMSLGRLQPIELYSLILSYEAILKLGIEIDGCVNEIKRVFNEEQISKCNIEDIEKSVFNRNIYIEIDTLEDKINKHSAELNEIALQLSTVILQNSNSRSNRGMRNGKKGVETFVKLKQKTDGGYDLETTNTRAKILKKFVTSGEYEYEQKSSTTKIKSKRIDKLNAKLVEEKVEFIKIIKQKYVERIVDIYGLYQNVMHDTSKKVEHLDFINSCFLCAKEYGYTRPIIHERGIEVKDMRHPIIERINDKINFTPNDVSLCENGILLYGLNGSGKSSYMKAIGLNIILAQCGMFVPAKEFKFSPIEHIFTRITGDDNMYKGQSSFDVEMTELRSIIKYADNKSLVLGDEICRGTEDLSAVSLICATIQKLCSGKVKFVFATHLHKLASLIPKSIVDSGKLNIFHLSVEITDSQLIYSRKLKPGSGTSLYGLEVAKFIIDDNELMRDAYKIRDILVNKQQMVVSEKTSKYNSDVYVTECYICKSTEQLDTHHIIHQSKCNSDGLYEHIRKDAKSNLVVLCKQHHQATHKGKYVFDGYKETSNGIMLEYKEVGTPRKKKKYSQEQIDQILKFGQDANPTYVKNEFFKKNGIKISTSTIKKILAMTY